MIWEKCIKKSWQFQFWLMYSTPKWIARNFDHMEASVSKNTIISSAEHPNSLPNIYKEYLKCAHTKEKQQIRDCNNIINNIFKNTALFNWNSSQSILYEGDKMIVCSRTKCCSFDFITNLVSCTQKKQL